jgi:hypothetical protein
MKILCFSNVTRQHFDRGDRHTPILQLDRNMMNAARTRLDV